MNRVPTVWCLSILASAVAAAPAEGQESAAADLAVKAADVLRTNCYRCHGENGAVEGGFNFALDRPRLVETETVVPGDPEKSLLYRRVVDDEMPPADEEPRPSPADIAVLKKWIEAGAADFIARQPPRDAISPEDVVALIARDLAQVEKRSRRFTRYFTLTHLYNAGLAEDELTTYRLGLSKLVNSLSWGPKIEVPQPIDEARTIFRIDLRHYRWNARVWDRIVARDPYSIVPADTAADIANLYARADWFVFAAARPPLYHEVLQLPQTAEELEAKLDVNVVDNVDGELVVRAAFDDSGVAEFNRLIERHETGYGAYWKSYDFASNDGLKHLFEHPLDFQEDGGEIIFNLPNGLQAYLIVDANGGRIDEAPLAVVIDREGVRKGLGAEVINGISCMSCHARGINEKQDQVRNHIENNPNAFNRKDAETILALHVGPDELGQLMQEDADRFQQAVAATGGEVRATEPIVALSARFQDPLNLALAAAEAGVAPADFQAALAANSALARALGLLKSKGGTVKRAVFLKQFPALIEELDVGALRKLDDLPPDESGNQNAGGERPDGSIDGDFAFSEDFGKTATGALPAGWTCSDKAIAVQDDGQAKCLELGDVVESSVRLPAQAIRGNFFVECQLDVAGDYRQMWLELREKPNRPPIRVAIDQYGAVSLAATELPRVVTKTSPTGATNRDRLYLEREGAIYRVKLNDAPLIAQELDYRAGFEDVRLFLVKAGTASPRIFSIAIGPLSTDVPPQEPEEGAAVVEGGADFAEDFSATSTGALPEGWSCEEGTMTVQADDGGNLCLEMTPVGTATVTLPKQAMQGDFFLECEFMAAGAYREFAIEMREKAASQPGRIKVDQYGAVALATTSRPGTLHPSLRSRLYVERRNGIFRVKLNDELLIAQPQTRAADFADVRLSLTTGQENATAKIYAVRIGRP